jgi:hypothetical protein
MFYSDPAHGWLRVKLSELEDLGLTKFISEFSYKNGKYAYLEEDRDANLFVKVKGKNNVQLRLKQSNGYSKIRTYDRFPPIPYEPNEDLLKLAIAIKLGDRVTECDISPIVDENEELDYTPCLHCHVNNCAIWDRREDTEKWKDV